MSYMALYRKWRPATFDEVKGQDAIVQTLRNQIIYDRIGHAYLFCGTRGTGKTSIAKLFARAVNCRNPIDGNPCNECPSCRAIQTQSSLDVYEIDAASNNGVEHIRDLREQIQYSPVEGRYKVYIIDEVHMLSMAAFNALLKTLEEPPAYVIFILATTEKHKVPITILSRCQKYDFKRIPVSTITDHLTVLMDKEGIEAKEMALSYIARAADGSMRDALSLLDQCISFYLGEKLTYEHVLSVLGAADTGIYSDLLSHMLRQDSAGVLDIVEDVVMEGRDIPTFLGDFLWYLRNLMVLKDGDGNEESLGMSAERIAILKKEAGQVDIPTLLRYIRILSELTESIRNSTQKRVLLEIGFIRLCQPEMETDTDSLASRIALLERKLEEGIVLPAAPPVSPKPAVKEEPEEEPDPEEEFQSRFSPAEQEDLIQIAANWPEVTAKSSALMRQYLKAFTPSVSDEAKRLLLVPIESGADAQMAQMYFTQNHNEKLDELARIVLEATDKVVEFECLAPGRRDSGTAPISLDLIKEIEQVIHFPITVEE